MNAHTSLKSTLLIATAAMLCAGLQLAAIDTLAASRGAAASQPVLLLPMVLVTAEREPVLGVIQQLPQVVVSGRLPDRDAATARAEPAKAEPAS